jgi:hypothetical protein
MTGRNAGSRVCLALPGLLSGCDSLYLQDHGTGSTSIPGADGLLESGHVTSRNRRPCTCWKASRWGM